MKRILSTLLLSTFLFGCSSNPSDEQRIKSVTLTGGQIQGDATSYYWYTRRLQQPIVASDYVTMGDYGWYKTTYRWEKETLVEAVREGEMLDSESELIPYSMHIRYNGNGEAVYQRYDKDGRILPLMPAQLIQFQDQSKYLVTKVEALNKDDIKLFQGEWDGETFYSCDGKQYDQLEFNQILPNFVVARLSGLDSFISFLGQETRRDKNELKMSELLLLTDDSYSCVERPELIED
ncbi:DUF1481 domain-containing protein [Aliivibrio fischeri]|uniref:Uncharacterized protein n=1 Tax=Aliivibrio fischeri (strain ATCC 700601 / ES114) TaxID=312309 RepID=Q5E255_ALIF1|nr:DUF1481 domain-containing protein [Aliivibrio fischeri]AAW86891.1 hypothetical protein VF_2396 [Aliivibrio fischeri ES114]KLU78600.1 peptidylprolyl isomerase [Aliivibrio fischeri]MCE7537459.1 DUF1481 domain-containing protein [Aliivibrio fischeri]MCE7560405.1 DUF1481 domain-containing protein [Aliivibrio fischeri]MUL08491.1 DUF1481 domain-containing protein [Aliivibrio fischeri]